MKTKKHKIVKTPGYKGFYHDMTTSISGRKNLTQWEEGKSVCLRSKTPPTPCSDKALHFCEEPSAVLNYYPPVEYGEKNKYAEVEASGTIVRMRDKTGCKALKVKKVFESIWDFAKSFRTVFNAAISSWRDWLVVDSECPVAGELNNGRPILLSDYYSAVKSYYPVVVHGMRSNLLESASLAMVLGGEQNMAVSSSCAVIQSEGGYVFAEVTSPAGIAVVLVSPDSREYGPRAFVRGVGGSTFIFLRSCGSPVIVKVDGDKIKAGRYYYMNIDGTVEEYKDYNPESKGV